MELIGGRRRGARLPEPKRRQSPIEPPQLRISESGSSLSLEFFGQLRFRRHDRSSAAEALAVSVSAAVCSVDFWRNAQPREVVTARRGVAQNRLVCGGSRPEGLARSANGSRWRGLLRFLVVTRRRKVQVSSLFSRVSNTPGPHLQRWGSWSESLSADPVFEVSAAGTLWVRTSRRTTSRVRRVRSRRASCTPVGGGCRRCVRRGTAPTRSVCSWRRRRPAGRSPPPSE